MNNMCMHLTNYAINKKSKDFVFNKGDDSVGHKRSFSTVLEILK
jgi:tubulin polyglutamylase TTLL6/13